MSDTHFEIKDLTDGQRAYFAWINAHVFTDEQIERIMEKIDQLQKIIKWKEAENDRLRERIHELEVEGSEAFYNESYTNDENRRLRELVRDMYAAFVHGNCYRWCEFKDPCNYIDDGKCQWYDRMAELGVEVDA